jgi:hypothetical protein
MTLEIISNLGILDKHVLHSKRLSAAPFSDT